VPEPLRELMSFLVGALRREAPIAGDASIEPACAARVAGNERLSPARPTSGLVCSWKTGPIAGKSSSGTVSLVHGRMTSFWQLEAARTCWSSGIVALLSWASAGTVGRRSAARRPFCAVPAKRTVPRNIVPCTAVLCTVALPAAVLACRARPVD